MCAQSAVTVCRVKYDSIFVLYSFIILFFSCLNCKGCFAHNYSVLSFSCHVFLLHLDDGACVSADKGRETIIDRVHL